MEANRIMNHEEAKWAGRKHGRRVGGKGSVEGKGGHVQSGHTVTSKHPRHVSTQPQDRATTRALLAKTRGGDAENVMVRCSSFSSIIPRWGCC